MVNNNIWESSWCLSTNRRLKLVQPFVYRLYVCSVPVHSSVKYRDCHITRNTARVNIFRRKSEEYGYLETEATDSPVCNVMSPP